MKTLKELGVTPEPWTAEDTLLSFPLSTFNVRACGCNIASHMTQADAILTAAAPDMYNAIVFIREHIAISDLGGKTGGQAVCDEANQLINEAIIKAGGDI